MTSFSTSSIGNLVHAFVAASLDNASSIAIICLPRAFDS
jgi:hypothetical protein